MVCTHGENNEQGMARRMLTAEPSGRWVQGKRFYLGGWCEGDLAQQRDVGRNFKTSCKNRKQWRTQVNIQQGRSTISNRYTHREMKLKFRALLTDYDLKYAENSKKKLLKHASDLIYRSICRNSYF